jgi:thioredoxin 1
MGGRDHWNDVEREGHSKRMLEKTHRIGKMGMRNRRLKVIAGVIGFWGLFVFAPSLIAATPSREVPVKGMVTMVDLGATACIPCKMMAPILAKLEKEYAGRAAIVFLDVWKDRAPIKQFGIRVIPTQIFFDEGGKEVFRHVGFMNEAAIVKQLNAMGVQ